VASISVVHFFLSRRDWDTCMGIYGVHNLLVNEEYDRDG